MRTRHFYRALTAAALIVLVAAVLAARISAAGVSAYVQHDLVSDGFLPADHVDPNLVNAWGLTAQPASPWWVADNGTDVSTIYTADGTPRPLVVSVPNAPTGAVSNTGSSFVVGSGPALFLFATEEGKILGWNAALGTTAQVAVDRSGDDAIFKGLAIAGDRLYATDFHNGQVDVFDGSFGQVDMPGAFVDPSIPPGFAPFGIQNVGGDIFVTYAKQDADREDDVAGPGLGFVDEFDTSGTFLGRVATRGQLNSPWGLAMAPAAFGRFGGDLLVGNFGDGRITAFE
ncbi:MAG: TIGR03118 family protein, partial [Deltaproteobacteria bacterium]